MCISSTADTFSVTHEQSRFCKTWKCSRCGKIAIAGVFCVMCGDAFCWDCFPQMGYHKDLCDACCDDIVGYRLHSGDVFDGYNVGDRVEIVEWHPSDRIPSRIVGFYTTRYGEYIDLRYDYSVEGEGHSRGGGFHPKNLRRVDVDPVGYNDKWIDKIISIDRFMTAYNEIMESGEPMTAYALVSKLNLVKGELYDSGVPLIGDKFFLTWKFKDCCNDNYLVQMYFNPRFELLSVILFSNPYDEIQNKIDCVYFGKKIQAQFPWQSFEKSTDTDQMMLFDLTTIDKL